MSYANIKKLHSKIHNIMVTNANLNYVGSITLDLDFIEKAGMIPWQEVFIVNNNNGARFETYIIPGRRGGKDVCLNGAAARLVQVGDTIIIMSYVYKTIEISTDGSIIESDNRQPIVIMPEYVNDSIFADGFKTF